MPGPLTAAPRTLLRRTSARLHGATAVLSLCAALVVAPAAAAESRTDGTPPVVSAGQVMPHLHALQQIADRNGGNRAHGTPGYRDSVAYVKAALDKAGFQTSLHKFTYNGTEGYNLIADWPGGDADHILFAGAHLDSVEEGPGMNDNGSGSTALLATALEVSKAGLKPDRHLRFAWWGAEEQGLKGSEAYLRDLPAAERARIDLYLNVDMAGTKDNKVWYVVDDNAAAAKAFKDYFAARKLRTEEIGVGGSDHESFGNVGIPTGGFATEINECLHEACDRIEQIDPETETTSTNAFISTVWQLAARS
ncbi:M28 family peptidase [Streptomyces sp. NBC_00829]|uniref:M28 family peptidase n=1 Tax=Streptomyces sp. NBC_00829 TaxID=2903679 RepID=UPI00386DAD0C|nr:M28 family peptidase [Streptomyces sp. NBC_00829]